MATARQAQRYRVEARERIRARMRQTSSKGCKERLGGRERHPNAATFLGDAGVIPPGDGNPGLEGMLCDLAQATQPL